MLEKDICSPILEGKHHGDPGLEVLETWLCIHAEDCLSLKTPS